MNNINFSLLIPVRCCPEQLKLMIDSIYQTVGDRKTIELLIGIDDDDMIVRKAISFIQTKYRNENISVHSRPRGNSLVEHYFNWLAKNYSKGKYIMVTNHDCLFKSQDWDINCFKRLEEYLKDKADNLVYGLTQDCETTRTLDKKITNFPIISKNAIDVLGYVLDPRILRWGADIDIAELYQSVDRVLDLRDICIIEHRPDSLMNLIETGAEFEWENWKKSNYEVWLEPGKIDKGDKRRRIDRLEKYIDRLNNPEQCNLSIAYIKAIKNGN